MAGTLTGILVRYPALKRIGDLARRDRIPFIPQHTATDCGPTCLAMVLRHFGREVRIDELRAAMSAGRDGVNALAIVEAARLYGLRSRGVKIDVTDLPDVDKGTILHWGFDHFVVFDRVDETGKIVVVDPAFGPRELTRQEVSKSFTGVALLLEKTEEFKPGKLDKPLFAYLKRTVRETRDWSRILVLSLLLQVCGMALPLVNGRLVDRVIPRNDGHLLFVLMVGLVSLVFFEFLAMFTRTHLLLNLRTRLDARMTIGFLEHMLALPYAFFQRRPAGDLLMRLNANAQIREALTSGVMGGVIDGVLVLVYLVLLVLMSPLMALVAIALVASEGVLFLSLRNKQVALAAGSMQKQAENDSTMVEMLSGIETLKATGMELRAAQRWTNVYVDQMNLSMRRGRMGAWSDALLGVVSTLSPFILLLVGTMEVMKAHMTLGTMMSVLAFANGFIRPVSNLVSIFSQMQTVSVSIGRIEDVLSTPKEQEKKDLKVAPSLKGRVTLTDVSFRYGPKAPLVVQTVTVDIAPGQNVAIVGRSGSGKSTLASLLCGLYMPTSGRVAYDGMDLGGLDLASVRRKLGIVIQRPHVFGTSVRANITMNDPDVPLERVVEAAKAACIHDEIAKMPLGYDTPLTAGGASLSGGQRQRIALARALLRKPSIMLLDEATSALDNVTEKSVHDKLQAMGCTRIVIAHRLSTVRNADVILVMENGKLVERGKHEELMKRNGAYAKLVEAGGAA